MPTPPTYAPITYSANDTVSNRWTGQGSVLSAQQGNYNFWNHDERIGWLETNYSLTVGISTITSPTPGEILFTLTDSSTQGPFAIPAAAFRSRGAWAPFTAYAVNDTVTNNGTVYDVPFAHTSAATFDPGANDGLGHDYYSAMLTLPGNSLPTGGAARMSLKKSTSSNYAVTWGFDIASDVIFTPSTASGLTATDVASALEELEALIASGAGTTAVHVSFTPPTSSWLTATNVALALDQLAAINAVHVTFTPPTSSSLTATNVAAALVELEALIGGGAGTLHGLSDVNVSEGSGIDGYVLYWNNSVTKWQAKALATVATSGAYSDLSGAPSLGTASSHAATDFLAVSGGTMTGTLTLAADPASALQAATKQYVDNLLQGLTPKQAVLCATTANITLSGEQTIDGIATSASRVLVKNQTSASANGIYVSASGSWTRATDMDAWSEVPSAYVFVEEGSTNADTGWVCTSDPGGTLGSTSISWVKFTGGSATALSALSDVNVSEGAGIDGYVLYWNNSTGKWQSKAAAASSGSGLQKGDGSGGFSAATAGTDYLAPPSGTALLKANSGGALANATAGTDYLAPPTGSSLLKANSGGALANASAGVDYGRTSVDQNSQSAAYTTVLSDAGKHIYHPSGDNNARTFTIDSNANVAYPIGTAITFINEINTVTIAVTSDTMVLAGSGATGSRTLAANGMATAIKVGTTRWYISGSGLT